MRSRLSTFRMVSLGLGACVLGSAALMVVATFGQWAHVLGFAAGVAGDDTTDGQLLIIAAVTSGGWFYIRLERPGAAIPALLGGLAGIAASLHYRSHLHDGRGLTGTGLSPLASLMQAGWGLKLALAASITMSASSLLYAVCLTLPASRQRQRATATREASRVVRRADHVLALAGIAAVALLIAYPHFGGARLGSLLMLAAVVTVFAPRVPALSRRLSAHPRRRARAKALEDTISVVIAASLCYFVGSINFGNRGGWIGALIGAALIAARWYGGILRKKHKTPPQRHT